MFISPFHCFHSAGGHWGLQAVIHYIGNTDTSVPISVPLMWGGGRRYGVSNCSAPAHSRPLITLIKHQCSTVCQTSDAHYLEFNYTSLDLEVEIIVI